VSDASLQPILALIGYPVAGNPTQFMMERAFARHQLDCRFLTLEVAPDALGDAVRGMLAMGFLGGKCADPHKKTVIPFLGRTTEIAALVGAVNFIVRDGDDLIGDNTEGRGLLSVLRRLIDPAGKRVVLLGAGNVARAIGVELAAANVAEFVVVNRDEARGTALVDLLAGKLHVPATWVPWDGDYAVPPETQVLIHATSLGCEDVDARVPLRLDTLRGDLIVADLTVDPPRTQLLCEAQQRGCRTIDGLEMFVHQAAIELQRWTSVEPDPVVMREAVEEFLLL
jgi:shikimate dehydrogenase